MPRTQTATPDPRGLRVAALVSRLRTKYSEILALRDAHARGEDPPDVRTRMRALAAHSPGALRELDRLPRETLVAKLTALEEAARTHVAEPWMIAMDRYHRWLRVGLVRRSALGGRSADARLVTLVLLRVGEELGHSPAELDALLGLRRRTTPPLPDSDPA